MNSLNKMFPFFIKYTRTRSIVKHVLYWLLFVLFFTLIWGTFDNDYYRNLMIQLYSLPARVTLVYVSLYVLIPAFFLKKQYSRFIIFFLLLLVGVSVFIQRPLIYYVVQANYMPGFRSAHFFAVTELMNTILDVNLAVIIPLSYVFFKSWQNTAAIEPQQSEADFIYLKIEKSLQKVPIKDIVYIESQKNYIKLITTEREILVHKSISSVQKSLPTQQFLRVHRSYLVAIGYITSFSPSKLMLNDISIPVGRTYKDAVKDILGYF